MKEWSGRNVCLFRVSGARRGQPHCVGYLSPSWLGTTQGSTIVESHGRFDNTGKSWQVWQHRLRVRQLLESMVKRSRFKHSHCLDSVCLSEQCIPSAITEQQYLSWSLLFNSRCQVMPSEGQGSAQSQFFPLGMYPCSYCPSAMLWLLFLCNVKT